MRIHIHAVLGIALLSAYAAPAAPPTPPASAKPKAKAKVDPPPPLDGHFLIETYPIKPTAAAADPNCDVLPSAENRTLTSTDITALIGDPAPFSLASRGPRRILIYATHRDLTPDDNKILTYIKTSIDQLAVTGKFEVELKIPHPEALGDLGAAIGGLNYSDFTIESVGSDAIRVSADSLPACDDWRRFLTGVRTIAWRPYSVQPVDKVFYLDGSAVATALTPAGGGGSADTPKATTPNITVNAVGTQNSPAAAPSSDPAQTDSGGGNNTPTNKPAAASPAKGAAKTGSNSKTPSKGKGKGTGTTDPAADPSTTDTTKNAAAPAPKPAAAATAAATVPAAVSDTLIFSEPTPGDDAAVQEKRRIVSMLDLPRPEMIVNVWSAQISAADSDVVARSTRRFHDAVSASNDQLQNAIGRAWEAVKHYYASDSSRYNSLFRNYVVLRHVGETNAPSQAADFTHRAEDFLNYRTGASFDPAARNQWGACGAGQYCLGYTELLHPLKPRLMDLLLALAFAERPVELENIGLNAMENAAGTPFAGTCEDADHIAYADAAAGSGPFFRCFRQKANGCTAQI
jgi:hypothetical protein